MDDVEHGRGVDPVRIRLPQAHRPGRQIGPDRLEAHAPAHRREDRAGLLGQAVVEDDDGARHELIR